MNNKKKITLLTIGTIALFITLIITFFSIFKIDNEELQEVVKLTKEALTINGSVADGTIELKGAHNNSNFYKNGSFYYEGAPGRVNKVYIPTLGNVQLYCIQKGVAFRTNKETVDTIRALDGTTGTSTSSSHIASLPAKRYSNTYYVCVNNHTEMKPSGAYIVTTPNNIIAPYDGVYATASSTSTFTKGENISKEVRQVAMWLNMEMNTGESFYSSGARFTYIDMAEQLKDEAMDYRDYEDELKAHIDNPIKEVSTEKVNVKVSQKDEYLILGPYKIEYVEGNSSTAKFSGISNITAKGYNDYERQEFISNLNIIGYIQNGVENTLDFFTPTQADGYVDRNTNSYPISGQEFYIKVRNPNRSVTNTNNIVRYIDINVEYSYMTIYAIQCILQGHQLVATPIRTGHTDHYNRITGAFSYCEVNYRWQVTENPLPQQKMLDAWGERNLYKLNINLKGYLYDEPQDITMNLGGYVWEDALDGKTNTADGLNAKLYNGSDSNDRTIPNVKVTLYECTLDSNGNVQYRNGKPVGRVANLQSTEDRNKLTSEELLKRVNPQLTNEDGYYQFNGLDVSKKYYVTFEYNGQTYLPTEYLVTDKDRNGNMIHQNSVSDMVSSNLYNTDIWATTSKGTEDANTRNNYNSKFAEIGSSPKGYVSSNSLGSGKLLQDGNKYYNQTFSINDLMGYELQEDGKYAASQVQLIDEFYTVDANGNILETQTLNEGLISKKIKEYIKRNYKYPDQNALLTIYQDIVNEYARNSSQQEVLWKKLQYIEDCKIEAYTGSPYKNGDVDLYPVYNKFVVDTRSAVVPGVGTKPPIYNGQYYINLGLWRRQQNNIALRKDIYRTATKINGKTEVYKYNKRSDSDDYWEIQIRMQDYQNYYGTNYNREIYPSDYGYKPANTNLYGSQLELYVTYQIVVRNLSQGILNEITEVVDYYDKDYTYMPNLSWVMYSQGGMSEEVAVPAKSYYNMIDKLSLREINYAKNIDSSYSSSANGNGSYVGTSIYGNATKSDLEREYNSIYIHGLDNKKLQTGEDAYIYLTFKVKSDNNGPVILDTDDSLKQNYVEINGYKSYYKDQAKLPNDVIVNGNNTVAGLIDNNSTPGNLYLEDLTGNRYEKNFEDDTDRAKSIKVVLEQNASRKITGTVWEDERTKTVNDAIIGDGIRQNDEIGIKGITVELVEKLQNGKEYVWQTTETNENGEYTFSGFVPGNYIVRFRYGNTTKTVLTKTNGGENSVSYNGQDFKSTVYSKDLKDNITVLDYDDEYYDTFESDKLSANQSINVSDAKDLWENKTVDIGRTINNTTTYQNESYQGRVNVNNYSTGAVSNYKAQVLASPYAQTIDNAMIQELINNTNMVAETPIIIAEVEYNRTNSDGYNTESNGDLYLYNNEKNGNYTFNCIDFGLTERPKAQLEFDQKVSNVKVTLSDGQVMFDANKTVDNLAWLASTSYNLSNRMENNKYKEYYNQSKTNSSYNRYSYRTDINNIISSLYSGGRNGLIQAIIDSEFTHGATIQITYDLIVKNASETDYSNKEFYYSATGASDSNKVKTTANTVINYVSNNLKYRDQENTGWTLVKSNDSASNVVNTIQSDLLDNNVKSKLNLYTNILQTTELNRNLKPGEQTSKKLVLTQTILDQDGADNKNYENIAEIVQTSNTVGRRMAYSIVGNQDPTTVPSEVDTAKSEQVAVIPPFGAMQFVYYAIILLVVVTLLTGIIIIRKKAINKDEKSK